MLVNVYVPNGRRDHSRVPYKLRFYQHLLEWVDDYHRSGESVVIVGDLNTAHKEIDLARPKQNEDVSGFLPIERAWLDQVVDNGYLDALREFHPEPELYSWWDLKSRARERNVGWRIDYFFVQKQLCKERHK